MALELCDRRGRHHLELRRPPPLHQGEEHSHHLRQCHDHVYFHKSDLFLLVIYIKSNFPNIILIFQDGDFLQVDLFCCCSLENSADDDGQ